MDAEEVPEEELEAGEEHPADHDHDQVEMTDESLAEHLVSQHGVDIPDRLSLGTLEGLHDRFHGESHAIDD